MADASHCELQLPLLPAFQQAVPELVRQSNRDVSPLRANATCDIAKVHHDQAHICPSSFILHHASLAEYEWTHVSLVHSLKAAGKHSYLVELLQLSYSWPVYYVVISDMTLHMSEALQS